MPGPSIADDPRPRVVALHVAPERHAPVRAVVEVVADAGAGLVGDRYHGSRHRHVSLQSATDLAAAELGRPVPPSGTRRNVTLSHGTVPTEPGAAEVHRTLLAEESLLGEVVWRDAVAALVDRVVAMHTVRDRVLHRLVDSPATVQLTSRLVARIVTDVLTQQRSRAEKVPGVSSLLSLGSGAVSRVGKVGMGDFQLDRLLGDAVGAGAPPPTSPRCSTTSASDATTSSTWCAPWPRRSSTRPARAATWSERCATGCDRSGSAPGPGRCSPVPPDMMTSLPRIGTWSLAQESSSPAPRSSPDA